jgi:hypothetical protein
LAVAGSQSEKTKDEEQKESERGEDGHVSEVRIPISPLPDPTGYPSHLAHVRRRREGAGQNRQQETCGK